MPTFIDYDVQWTNMKPWNGQNIGSGTTRISLPDGTISIKAALKRALERRLNSLGMRVDSFMKVVA